MLCEEDGCLCMCTCVGAGFDKKIKIIIMMLKSLLHSLRSLECIATETQNNNNKSNNNIKNNNNYKKMFANNLWRAQTALIHYTRGPAE